MPTHLGAYIEKDVDEDGGVKSSEKRRGCSCGGGGAVVEEGVQLWRSALSLSPLFIETLVLLF